MPHRRALLEKWLKAVLDVEDVVLESASGDASFRSYWRLEHHGRSYIAMDAPPESEDTERFVRIGRSLRLVGLNTPEVFFEDPGQGFQWDPNKIEDEERTQNRALELHYQASHNRLLNLAYRFDAGQTEATRYEDLDLSMRWPVTSHVEVVGRWFYSLLNSRTTEALAGIEFGRCCWRLRVLGRHLQNKPETPGETSVMVQLELAGLGNFGHSIDKLLERGIYGYRTD